MIQMRVDGGRKEANLARAAGFVHQAAEAGAKVVLLPEAMDLGWLHPSARNEAELIPGGATCCKLSELARIYGLFICAGLTERSGEKVFNSAVLISPGGEVLIHHRKLNELSIGHDCYAEGDRLAVVVTPLGRIGVMICADAFARGQIVTRTLGLMGAEMILSPSAWAVLPDHDNERDPYGKLWIENYAPVAREFGLWIAGCSNVGAISGGPWAGRKCIGSSLLVNPDGEVACRGPYGVEAIVYSEVALSGRSESTTNSSFLR